MKNNVKLAIILTLIFAYLLSSCHSPQDLKETSDSPSVIIDNTEQNVDPGREITAAYPELDDSERNGLFTIEADENLKRPITLLFQAFFVNIPPEFVDTGGELVATQFFECDEKRPCIWATFLPGSVLINQSENPDIDEFIAFVISAEGQQVLVKAGELPGLVQITDQADNSLEIPQPIHRVISTYGPATSFMYSLQVYDRLVSASYLGARDPSGASIMRKMDPRFPDILGDEFFSQSDFNVEQAAALNPDLIVTSTRTSWLEAVDQLGIDVFLFDAETPDRLKEAMHLTGILFGPNSSALAETWNAYYDHIVEEIKAQTTSTPDDQRPRVLFTGTEPLRVASGDMYQTDIIQAAGGVSVSSELSGYWNEVDLEQVVLWNPDIIIVPPYGGASVEAISQSSEWQILEAVKDGQVYQMPKLVVPWDTPAADSVLGIVWLAQLINSEFTVFNCASEAEYFYNAFYNYPISTEEIESVCKFE